MHLNRAISGPLPADFIRSIQVISSSVLLTMTPCLSKTLVRPAKDDGDEDNGYEHNGDEDDVVGDDDAACY